MSNPISLYIYIYDAVDRDNLQAVYSEFVDPMAATSGSMS